MNHQPTANEEVSTEQPGEGGKPACWKHLVSRDCGAVSNEGHREGCEHVEMLRRARGQPGESALAHTKTVFSILK